MLHKLQRKTLPKGQLLGYAFALMVAVVLLGGIWQLYRDVKPLLEKVASLPLPERRNPKVNLSIKPLESTGKPWL